MNLSKILGAFFWCLWQYSNFKVLESRKNFPTSQKEGNSLKEADILKKKLLMEELVKNMQSNPFSKYVRIVKEKLPDNM